MYQSLLSYSEVQKDTSQLSTYLHGFKPTYKQTGNYFHITSGENIEFLIQTEDEIEILVLTLS